MAESPAAIRPSHPTWWRSAGRSSHLNGDTYGGETAWSFPTPRTLDNGSSSYSQTGPGHRNRGALAAPTARRLPEAIARRPGQPPLSSSDQGWIGGTEVSATWVAAPATRRTPLTSIYDGTAATGTLLGTVTVNQTHRTGRHTRRRHAIPGAGRLLSREWHTDRRPEREVGEWHRGRRRRWHRRRLGHAAAVRANMSPSLRIRRRSRAPDTAQVPTCRSTAATIAE